MRRQQGLLLAATLVLTTGPATATVNNAGGSGAQFLRLGVGARALGMGDAYGPVAEGPNGLHWNPAGLAQMSRPEIGYSHSEMMRFYHHEYISYAHPIYLLKGTIGGSMNFFYEDPQDSVTNTNKDAGSFKNHSEVYTLAYARGFRIGTNWGMEDRSRFEDLWRIGGAEMPLRPEDDVWNGNLLLGVAIKAIRSTLGRVSANAYAVDFGALFRHTYFPKFRGSFTMKNFGTNTRFINVSERLPAEVALGLSYDQQWERHRLLPAFEIVVPFYGAPNAKMGVEYTMPVKYESLVSFRGGYKTLEAHELHALAGITGGIGFTYKHFSFDMGFQPMSVLGQTFRFEAGYRF